MTRTLALALLLSAVVAGLLLTWYSARQQREYRRLIAAGDAALAQDQTVVAIEAYSGAAAIQPQSMLAYLKRGDTYRRQGLMLERRLDRGDWPTLVMRKRRRAGRR